MIELFLDFWFCNVQIVTGALSGFWQYSFQIQQFSTVYLTAWDFEQTCYTSIVKCATKKTKAVAFLISRGRKTLVHKLPLGKAQPPLQTKINYDSMNEDIILFLKQFLMHEKERGIQNKQENKREYLN